MYIGQTINPSRREIRHFSDLKLKTHDNYLLQKDYESYGRESFVFSILEEIPNCTFELLDKKERDYIK